jgi:hypothetical protein
MRWKMIIYCAIPSGPSTGSVSFPNRSDDYRCCNERCYGFIGIDGLRLFRSTGFFGYRKNIFAIKVIFF